MDAEQTDQMSFRIPEIKRYQPDQVGPYEIEREIGKGVLGTVYLGRDTRTGEPAAIKTVPLADEFQKEHLERVRRNFFREAKTAGQLDHPAIVTVHEVGESGQLAYIAMEYLTGHPLSEHITADRLLPACVVLDLMTRVAEGIGYAHDRGVIHRDIKPANLIYDPAGDSVKITDFGLATLTDSGQTKSGIRLGTPSFTPPEQLAGSPATRQSDVFSLGVTLYQLLTGCLPFHADSLTALMRRINEDTPTPLSEARPDLPPGLEKLIGRALKKDPADRFQYGAELAAAIGEQRAVLTEDNSRT